MLEKKVSKNKALKDKESEGKALTGQVSGRVQGVGFRCFTQENAQRLGLSGFVRNMPDSSVEFWIQGSTINVESMLSRLLKGPEFSHVESCERHSVPFDDSIVGFEIRF